MAYTHQTYRSGHVVLSLVFIVGVGVLTRPVLAGHLAIATNDSVNTECAEFDNVNVPLLPPSANEVLLSFQIEALHPGYVYDVDHREPNFDGCVFEPGGDYEFPGPVDRKLYDDGEMVVVAHRQERWWQPQGMRATVVGDTGAALESHRLAIHRKLAEEDSWPQVMVFYQDGNLRLIPHKQPGVDQDPVFGSSIVIGPARRAERPFVTVQEVQFDPEATALNILYDSGENARIVLEEANRERTRVRVEAAFATSEDMAFATFRSMYVEDGNADVDQLTWQAAGGEAGSAPIMDFTQASSVEFLFLRETVSVHNTSAPDIRISEFEFTAVPEPASLVPIFYGIAFVWIHWSFRPRSIHQIDRISQCRSKSMRRL